MVNLTLLNNVVCLKTYKEKREELILLGLHDMISENLHTIFNNFTCFENLLLMAENAYGPKILRKLEKRLSKKEKELLQKNFEIIESKARNSRKKVIQPPPYKKSKTPP